MDIETIQSVLQQHTLRPKMGSWFQKIWTMSVIYDEVCICLSEGEDPWQVIGNFTNEWFAYHPDIREYLVAEPIPLTFRTYRQRQWAAFLAASVEWFCDRHGVACPDWVHHPRFVLELPFYGSWEGMAHIYTKLWETTPPQFFKRNVLTGNRTWKNKFEVEDLLQKKHTYRQLKTSEPGHPLSESAVKHQGL